MDKTKVALLGEDLVAKWLKNQGWSILHQRWFCKRGEIDVIARKSDVLAFVEVKTRAIRNLDVNGLLSITPSKQAKIYKTAEFFLAAYPYLAALNCRFDVASVVYSPREIKINETVGLENYDFVIQEYIEGAFD